MAKNHRTQRFAVCISDKGCDDLEVRKIYPVLTDEEAEREDFLRIVDESGEDYLYPARRFVVLELTPAVARRLRPAVQPRSA